MGSYTGSPKSLEMPYQGTVALSKPIYACVGFKPSEPSPYLCFLKHYTNY